MPKCALTTAGKAAIDAAAAGALTTGQFKIGATAGDVLSVTSIDISGTLTHTGAAADLRLASFGSNKLNLYVRLFGAEEIVVGNMIIYLSDNTTPLAFLTLDQRMVKRANAANKAQDAIVFVLSLRRSGISGKFTIAAERSRNFAVPVHQTRQEFEASRDLFGIISALPEIRDRPAAAFKYNEELWINPSFEKTDAGGNAVSYMSGGVVGDQYVDSDFDWTMEWV